MPDHKLLVFTGPIDAFFASQGMPKLEYRSIIFEVRKLAFKGLNGNGDVALIFIHAKPNFGQLGSASLLFKVHKENFGIRQPLSLPQKTKTLNKNFLLVLKIKAVK